MSVSQNINWDGVQYCYIPPAELRIPPSVKISSAHTKGEDIDPITYEVIRHRIWRAVWDGGITTARMCVSPITWITRDLQSALFLENGDCVFFGPFLQYMAGMLEPSLKWILENRGEDPGINPGDIFLMNDPWIGTVHQPDVGLMGPIFVDDKIFAWTGITEHQNDLGGNTPGSFCMSAPDVFSDPQPIPPIKIVKGGNMDKQLLDLYMRMSRTPRHLELDLRAGLAGNKVVHNQIQELIQIYGHQLVKGVMLQIINNSEKAFLDKMAEIPDGIWSQTGFMEGAMSGDRKAHRVVLTMEKQKNELFFTNEGTDLQVGSINLTYAGWRGAIMSMISVILLPEQMGAIGGAMRHCHFDPVPGTITCPTYGAAVSPAGTFQAEFGLAMAHANITRMLLCSRDRSVVRLAYTTTPGFWPAAMGGGFTRSGEFYVAPYGIDGTIGSSAASVDGDGVFGGGVNWIPDGKAANTEENERNYPCLCLWRKMVPHSSVPGKFVSGESALVAFTAHTGTHAPVFAVNEETPNTPGIFGLPGTRQKQTVIENTNLKEMFEKGEMPSSIEDLTGQLRRTQPKESLFGVSMFDLGELNGVFEWSIPSCSALGDPLARDPYRVQADVVSNRYTVEHAKNWFGVVLKPNGEIELEATENERARLKRERLDKSEIPKGGA